MTSRYRGENAVPLSLQGVGIAPTIELAVVIGMGIPLLSFPRFHGFRQTNRTSCFAFAFFWAKAATKPADFFFEVNPDSLFERRWRLRHVKLVTAKTMHVLANRGRESCDHLEASLGSFLMQLQQGKARSPGHGRKSDRMNSDHSTLIFSRASIHP